jgi:hypothetical protein
MNTLLGLSASQLRQAANIREKIQALESELSSILGGDSLVPDRANGGRLGRRRMSAAGRRAIAAAAKARWAKVRGNQPAKAESKGRRKMSAAAKARLSAIAKARWKKAKAAGKGAL